MLNFIKELLFPRFCLICNHFGSYICVNCRKKMVYLPEPICLYCEKPSEYGKTHRYCRTESSIDGYIAVFKYTKELKKVVASIKYKLVSDAFTELFSLSKDVLQKDIGFLKTDSDNSDSGSHFFIQPIPLHPKRQNQRGFNQSEIIGSFLSSITGFKKIQALKRVKETRTQAQLNKTERQINAENAFALNNNQNIVRKNTLIIDDVVTTGSTVKEAARVLLSGGVAKIWVLSIAKG